MPSPDPLSFDEAAALVAAYAAQRARFRPSVECVSLRQALEGRVLAQPLRADNDQPPSKNRLIVPVEGTVAQINAAFNVSMGLYQHPTENRTYFSPDREPSLSASVPIAHIEGMNSFSLPRSLVVFPMQASQWRRQRFGSGWQLPW